MAEISWISTAAPTSCNMSNASEASSKLKPLFNNIGYSPSSIKALNYEAKNVVRGRERCVNSALGLTRDLLKRPLQDIFEDF